MDFIPKQLVVIVAVQVILVVLLYLGRARRLRRQAQTTGDSRGPVPTEERARHAGSWGWLAVLLVPLLAAVVLLRRPCASWYWSRHPPTIEHRDELLEVASKQLQCPTEQLTIEALANEEFVNTGARVTGCGGKTELCWGRSNRRGPAAWIGCLPF